MNKIKQLATGIALIAGVSLILTGCTTPVEEKVSTQDAIDTYKSFVDEVYNHNIDADTLYALNEEVVPLIPEGKQDEALKILKNSNIINTEHVMLSASDYTNSEDENASATMEFALNFRILGIMTLNGVNDTVSVKINPEAVTYVDDVYKIKRSGVTFESIKNETTMLADNLNKEIGFKSEKDSTIDVVETKDGLKVDLFTTDF